MLAIVFQTPRKGGAHPSEVVDAAISHFPRRLIGHPNHRGPRIMRYIDNIEHRRDASFHDDKLDEAGGNIMANQEQGLRYSLELLGSFRLLAPNGERIEITSRKGIALIALLAMAAGGERSRSWLQDKLWGMRDPEQARGSLRGELSYLRRQLNTGARPLLVCEFASVRLDLDLVEVGARDLLSGRSVASAQTLFAGEFLEGLDLSAEDEFEDWLREQRESLREASLRAQSTEGAPDENASLARVVDLSQPAPGFAGSPAIAVLPFLNLTGDSKNDYLSEGVSEDLIDRLSRLRWLPVIARGSSFNVDPAAISYGQVGRALGAKFLLEGRWRSLGEDLNLWVNLVEAKSEHVIWSHRADLSVGVAPPALQTMVGELVGILDTVIAQAQQGEARGKPQSDLNVSDLIWRGRWHLNRLTHADAEIAKRLFDEALALEPESPEALIQATYSMCWSIWAQRGTDERIRDMRRMAQRALNADSEDGRSHMLAGIAEMWLRNSNRAVGLLQQSITLNPSLAMAHAQLGSAHSLAGDPHRALEPLKTALRLSPTDHLVFYVFAELALAHGMLGDWTAAADFADQALNRRGSYWYAHVIRINALARGDDAPAARKARDELWTMRPNFDASSLDWVPFVDRRWAKHLKEGLEMASTPLRERDA